MDLLGLQAQQQPSGIAVQAAAAAHAAAAAIQTPSTATATSSNAATINALEALQKQQAVQVSTAHAVAAHAAAAQAVAQAQAVPSVNGHNSAYSNSSTNTTQTTNATAGLLSFPTSHHQAVVSGAGSNALLSHASQAGQSSLLGAMIAARASGAPILAQSGQPQTAVHAGVLAAHQQQQIVAAAQAQAQAHAAAAAAGNPLNGSNPLALAALQAQQNHPLLAQNAAAQIAQLSQWQQAAAQQAAVQAGNSSNTVAAMTPQGLILLPRQ